MRKRLVGLLGVAAIAIAACQPGTTSPSPSSPATSQAPTGSAPVTSGEPTGSADTGEVNLFNSTYAERAEEGTVGGQIIIGDWQSANQFNPYYLGQVTEANVASAAWATVIVLTDDYSYMADLATEVPTTENGGVTLGEGGDAMTVTWTLKPDLKWSDGEPLTCDDFLYAFEWVIDEENVGVITTGCTDITQVRVRSDDRRWCSTSRPSTRATSPS